MGDQAANISLQNTSCFTFLLFLRKGQYIESFRYDMFVHFTLYCLFIWFFILYLQLTLVFHWVTLFQNTSCNLQRKKLKNFYLQGNIIFTSIPNTQPAGSFVSLSLGLLFIHSYVQPLFLFYIVNWLVSLIIPSSLPYRSTHSPQVVDITLSIRR